MFLKKANESEKTAKIYLFSKHTFLKNSIGDKKF
ncbi:hypothetical protein Flavo103_42670 [Flavobacterium collinsii]|nr:hypothetical protein Flavo103_42670 [Flavobacterium collinsii]